MKKTILLAFLVLCCLFNLQAQTTLAKAKEEAKAAQKFILLNFSGSDWCLPCIQMEKEIFEKETFHQFAEAKLVWLNADFPRGKKLQPAKEQVKENEALAEQYNTAGTFPLTLLLDGNGKVVKEWAGKPNLSAEQFVQLLQAAMHAGN